MSATAREPDTGAPHAGDEPAQTPRILVVDDDATVRELVARHLERAGFAVTTAKGGQEGLRLARELRPAAVTLDIMMPDLDGWTVLAAMKGDPALASIPVVLMSIVEEKNRGYALGAADYLVKPVDRARLIEALRNICGPAAGRVLLIDDDDVVRRGVRLALAPLGWQVTEAENGQVALACLARSRPDVIILDLMMPQMDGFEFVDELRTGPTGAISRSSWSRRGTSPMPTGRGSTAGSSASFKRASATRCCVSCATSSPGAPSGRLRDCHEDSLRRGQRRQHLHAAAPAHACRLHGGHRHRRSARGGDGGERAARPGADGFEPAGARRLGGDTPDQGCAGYAPNSDHCAVGACHVRRPGEGTGRRLRRLRYQAGGARAPARQDPCAGAGGGGS